MYLQLFSEFFCIVILICWIHSYIIFREIQNKFPGQNEAYKVRIDFRYNLLLIIAYKINMQYKLVKYASGLLKICS